jgi:hypothetical protein
MIEDFKYIYKLFNDYKFDLINQNIDNKSIQLDFSRQENIIDKFSIIKNENTYYTIIPLKKDNFSFKTKFTNLNDLIQFIDLHLFNYVS